MKIAIHNRKGSYSSKWIDYCKRNNIDFRIVNAYDSDIVEQVQDCDFFLWHHHHANARDILFAKQLLYSLGTAGIKCFPDFHTTWHFDDKVGQKYLLEAIGAPLVPSYVFYSKKVALEWVSKVSYPIVFKLRGGAGASNVKLVHDKCQARRLIRKGFGRGFPQFDRIGYFKERFQRWRSGKDSLFDFVRGLGRLVVSTDFMKLHRKEKGYIYFQQFIPNNTYDTRIVVIGGKRALCEKRFCRPGDFRASGSGEFEYAAADKTMLEISFNVAQRLKLQSVAFDFVYDGDRPLIVEMSYAFGTKGISHCGGYYTPDLQWHEHSMPSFCDWIIEDLLDDNA